MRVFCVVLSRYEGEGIPVREAEEPVQILEDNGIIHHDPATGSTSLSTYLDTKPNPVEEDIDVLQSVHTNMRRRSDITGQGQACSSNYRYRQNTWSSSDITPLYHHDNNTEYNLATDDNNMEQAIDRLFKERQEHQKLLENVVSPQSFSGLLKPGGVNGDHLLPYSRETTTIGEQWGILEGSLNSLRGISNELLKHREIKTLESTLGQIFISFSFSH
ncbi:hypothetical protein LOTGIDRAFT_157705 [Lottia gigantea]|uniref:Uncharacterized protein n=1 Tax=Lottia gigantea TaxID=225164 RepID=V4CEU7_LOTGI|nr:hypothetical protein LOTGIDRAFT_157705 [Lottia gigantea]ESP00500.1 hypothetical protein LOTGIDRAFT_157705 [Lottia gigantea]